MDSMPRAVEVGVCASDGIIFLYIFTCSSRESCNYGVQGVDLVHRSNGYLKGI